MSKELPLNLADWDERCMEEFILRYSSAFRAFASRYVDDAEAIDDFLQEAYIRLWTYRKNIGLIESPRNYFYTLLYRVILDKRKYFSPLGQSDGEEPVDVSADETFFDRLVEVESSRLIAEAVRHLSPQSCRVILLTMEGRSMNEIGELLDITVNSVKTIKYRALKRLSELLSKEDFLYLLFLLSSLK